jgi:hypothetical protein
VSHACGRAHRSLLAYEPVAMVDLFNEVVADRLDGSAAEASFWVAFFQ